MWDLILLLLAGLGTFIWFGTFLQPWQSWSYRESLDSKTEDASVDLSDVTILTPARNEEDEIQATLESVKAQGGGVKMILVDDQSTDKTRERALQTMPDLQIISGTKLPNGWAGKLWALEQGRQHVKTSTILLMDADIQLKPGILKTLMAHMNKNNLSFVSLMATLRMESLWEKLLMPAYIYFFKLLYPFRLGNNPKLRFFAVAAGGCILIKREALEAVGGFGALKDALIDDCTLAKKVKTLGFDTWTGTTHSVMSHRGYDDLESIWNLVARFAFTYLRYSWVLLGICSLLLLSAYWAIPLALLLGIGSSSMKLAMIAGYALLFACYYPTVKFYRLNPLWTLLHPIAGTLYLAMTWSSALRYLKGQRSEWKGRSYDQNLNVQNESSNSDRAA